MTTKINQQVSTHLRLIGQLKNLDGANHFSVKSYAEVANTIVQLPEDITVEEAMTIPGIGSKIGAVIGQVLNKGESDELNDLKTRWPIEMLSLTIIPGIGPKRAHKLYQQGYHNFEEIHSAAIKGAIADAKLSDKVLLAALKKSGRHPRETVLPIAEYFQEALSQVAGVSAVEIGGSLRRQTKDVKDIDLLALVENEDVRPRLMEKFAIYGNGAYEGGDLKGSIQYPLSSEQVIQVDLWVATPDYWGGLLNHATGSKDFNIATRTLAKSRGMSISEYGIHDAEGNKLGGENEHDLFKVLDIPFVEPKDRTGVIPEGHYQ